MMEEEEEDTLFDQEGLLGRRDEAVSEKKEWKRKLLKTAALSMSFFCLGLCIAIPGPTLLDLGKRVNRNVEQMTFIFTARSVGYLIGSLTGGVLFDFFDQQILLFYTIAAVAVATASIPWCTALMTLSALVCVQGVGLGVLDTGGNIFCIKIWTHKSAPFMQALHFAFGIGAFLAPLMAQPFLVDPAVLSDNITKVDYYPVNFKLPSLESVSGHSRSVRGFHHYAYWEIDYTVDHESKHSLLAFQHSLIDSDRELLDRHNFTNPMVAGIISHQFSKPHRNAVNDVGQNPTNHNTSPLDETKNDSSVSQKYFGIQQNSSHNTDITSNVEDILFRYRREEADFTDAPNGTDTGNNTQEFGQIGGTNITVIPTPTTTAVRPIKPVYNDGRGLSGPLADSEKIIPKLKDIINNPPSENVKNTADIVPLGESTKDPDSNKMSSLVNTTVSSLDTDSLSGNDTHTIEETTTASAVSTTTAPSTVSTTTAPSTVSTTTAPSTVSTTTAPSTVSTTTAPSTVSTTTAPLTVSTTTAPSTVSTTTAPSTVSTTTAPSTVSTTTSTTTVSTTSTTTVRSTTALTSVASVATTSVASTSTAHLTPEPTTHPAELATKPFEAVDDLSTVNTSAGKNTSTRSEDDDLLSNVFAAVIGMSKIQIAYSLIGMLLAVNAGLFLFLYCKDRAQSSPAMSRSHEDMTRPPDTRCFVSLLIILLFLFFFTYVGMEVTFGGLLTTFAVYYPMERWTPSTAAVLTALFWGCLALGRCFAIFIARFFKPPCMMVSNLCLTVLGAVILILVQVNPAMLWIGTVTLGLGMSSLFPTAISWANSYYPLTGRATAIFVAGSGIGEMVIPVMTGFLFEKVNHMSFMYVTLTLSILMSLVYMGLQLVVYQRNKTSTRRSHSGFMRLNNLEDMNDAVDMDTVEFAEGGTTDITETTMGRSHREEEEEEEERKKNGDAYKTTEFTRLVELSD